MSIYRSSSEMKYVGIKRWNGNCDCIPSCPLVLKTSSETSSFAFHFVFVQTSTWAATSPLSCATSLPAPIRCTRASRVFHIMILKVFLLSPITMILTCLCASDQTIEFHKLFFHYFFPPPAIESDSKTDDTQVRPLSTSTKIFHSLLFFSLFVLSRVLCSG